MMLTDDAMFDFQFLLYASIQMNQVPQKLLFDKGNCINKRANTLRNIHVTIRLKREF